MSSVQAEHDDVDGPWLQNRPTEFRKMRRSGRSAVAMVQAAEDGRRHQATISVDLAGRGSVAVESVPLNETLSSG